MSGSISPPLLETVARRAPVIKYLLGGCADKRELEAALDVSRTTVDRAISSLSEAGCIAQREGKWQVTLYGELVYDEYKQLTANYEVLTAAQALLSHLPPGAPVDVELFADAEILLAEPPAPHGPVTQLEDLLEHSDQIRGLSSVALPSYVPLFYHHIVDRGVDTDLILDNDLVEHLWATHSHEMDSVLETDNGMIWWLDQKPTFATISGTVNLVIFDQTTGGTRYEDQIANYTGQLWQNIDEQFNHGMQFLFEAGHEYVLALEIVAYVEVLSIGFEAGSDWGPQDGDGGNTQGCYYDDIQINF